MTPADWIRAVEHQQACYRAEEQAKRQAHAARVARQAALMAELAAETIELVKAGSVRGMERHVEALLHEHRVRVTWSAHACYAILETRRVIIPRIRSEADYAGAVHEIAHVLNGDCPRTFPHKTTLRGTQLRCQMCEVHAWARAQRLAPVWTVGMHRELQRCLPSYTHVPAPPAMTRVMQDAVSNRRRAEVQQARFARELREARQRRVMESMR
jgi:hypothetical protein